MTALKLAPRAGGWCAILFISLLLPVPADAASIEATNAAAHNGSYGLEVTPSTPCINPDTVVLSDHVVAGQEYFEACKELSAASNFEVSDTGDATFTAGQAVSLQSGFRIGQEGVLSAVIDSGLLPLAYVQDSSPDSETTYSAGFCTNLDNATFDLGDEVEHLVAYAAEGISQFRILIRQEAGGPEVVLAVREDNGNVAQTTAMPLSGGWNQISVTWEAASNASAALSANGLTPAVLTGLNTDSGGIDFVRWGAVGGSFSKTPGYFFQDDFVSTR